MPCLILPIYPLYAQLQQSLQAVANMVLEGLSVKKTLKSRPKVTKFIITSI